MLDARTKAQRTMLAGMTVSGLDRLYQQLDNELGFILTLHRVREPSLDPFQPNAHLSVSADFLESVLQLVRARGLDVISMDEVAERLRKGGSGQKRFCAMTFDDAYKDTLVAAAPLLSSYNIPYTVYVAGGLVQGTAHLWWEKLEQVIRLNRTLRVDFGDGVQEVDCATSEQKYAVWCLVMDFVTEANPEPAKARWMADTCAAQDVPLDSATPGEIMSWEDVRTLNADPLCTIGSHTVSHSALARLPEEIMRHEIEAGGQAVREQIGHVPQHMAYPYGYRLAAGAREFAAARELGLTTVVTTRPGMLFADHANHMTALPRISVNGHYQSIRHFAPLTSGLPTRIKSRFRRLDVA